MGIIIRNGIPYGAADSKDITTVNAYADLADLAVKQADHIYIVDSTNSPYYYDETAEEFKLLGKEITGAAQKILVATGPDDISNPNWAVVNSPSYYAVTTRTNEETPGMPTEFTIGSDTNSSNYPAAFGHIGPSTTNPASVPSFHDGYITRDAAIQKIAGTAKINIGEDNADYTSDNRKFWDKELTGPRVDIGGTSIIEMEGTGDGSSDSDTPVLSMRGKCLIDMSGSLPLTNDNKWCNRQYTTSVDYPFNNAQNPFNNSESFTSSTEAFPYLHMHDSSTIMMDGAPILKMMGNSYVNIDGQVSIGIHGEEANGQAPHSSWEPRGIGPVLMDIRPNAFVQIGVGNGTQWYYGGPTSGKYIFSGLQITANHIAICGCVQSDSPLSTTDVGMPAYLISEGTDYWYEAHPIMDSSWSPENRNCFVFNSHSPNKVGAWSQTAIGQSYANWISNYGPGPKVHIHDRTNISIGDGGDIGMLIGGSPGSNITVQMDPASGSSFEIRAGSASNAVDLINIRNDSSSFTKFHHQSLANAAVEYCITPADDTYVKFAPSKKFYGEFSPKSTEILWQWNGAYVFLQGENHYIIRDGYETRKEEIGNIFIMRDDTTRQLYPERPDDNAIGKWSKSWQYTSASTTLTSLPASQADYEQTPEYAAAMNAFDNAKSNLSNVNDISGAYAYLGTSSTANYNQYWERYYNKTYPIQFYLRHTGSKTVNAVEFDSTTDYGGSSTTYTSIQNGQGKIGRDANFIAEIQRQVGSAFTFYTYPNQGYFWQEQTDNGYHYICYGFEFACRQTFTTEELNTNSWAPSGPSSGQYYGKYDEVYKQCLKPQYEDVMPSYWSIRDTGTYRPKTYQAGTATAENKWIRETYVHYSILPQADIEWSKPIQTDNTGKAKPVFQMYNRSNFMMRADTIFKPMYNEYADRINTTLYEYEFTPTDTYTGLITHTKDVTGSRYMEGVNGFIRSEYYESFVTSVEQEYPGDTVHGITNFSQTSGNGYHYNITYVLASDKAASDAEVISFINSADYTAFTSYLATEYPTKRLWRIAYLKSSTDNKFKVYFGLQDPDETEFLKDPSGDEPIFEMVGKSQLRMYNGAYIKGESKNGETVFTFGSTTTGEAPVSFTLAQLAAAISGGGAQLPNAADAQF